MAVFPVLVFRARAHLAPQSRKAVRDFRRRHDRVDAATRDGGFKSLQRDEKKDRLFQAQWINVVAEFRDEPAPGGA
jgi:hypothetical protein